DDVSFFDVRSAGEKRIRANVRERPSDFTLEKDYDDQEQVVKELLEDPVEGKKLQPNTSEVRDGQNAKPRKHLHRARVANQHENAIDHHPNKGHVEQVAHAQLIENKQ